jgi:hypothetical protein
MILIKIQSELIPHYVPDCLKNVTRRTNFCEDNYFDEFFCEQGSQAITLVPGLDPDKIYKLGCGDCPFDITRKEREG